MGDMADYAIEQGILEMMDEDHGCWKYPKYKGAVSKENKTQLYTFAWVMTKEQKDIVNDFVKKLLK